MSVHLTVDVGARVLAREGLTATEITRRARAMLRLLQLDKSELSILMTSDRQIHKLNRDYRDKDRPTDVLAFAMREGEFGADAGPLLGDVIVSIPTAARQAKERGATTLAEVTMLLAHGLLHLLGWDHDTERKDRAMRAETARLCAAAEPRRPSALSRSRRARKGPRGDARAVASAKSPSTKQRKRRRLT